MLFPCFTQTDRHQVEYGDGKKTAATTAAATTATATTTQATAQSATTGVLLNDVVFVTISVLFLVSFCASH